LTSVPLHHTTLPGIIATDLEIPLDLPRSPFDLLNKSWFSGRRHSYPVKNLSRLSPYYTAPPLPPSRQLVVNGPESQAVRTRGPSERLGREGQGTVNGYVAIETLAGELSSLAREIRLYLK
jgi:hypothetical protein